MSTNHTDINELIENLEAIKTNLENSVSHAMMWLSETLDFLSNDDAQMALWSYSQYMKVLDKIDIDLYKKSGEILYQRMEAIAK